MSDPEERDQRVMTLAAEALKISLHERDSFLQTACRHDSDLYRDVSNVVTWEERMSGFLDRPLIEFIDLDFVEQKFSPGQIVSGRFEIQHCVGDGGMGIVYEAYDRKRKQRIAIKVAKPGFGRLLSPELEGALKVRHPNICLVNEIHSEETEYGDLDFLTMEFLDGETLAQHLEQGKLEKAEALEIARQLCAGVAEAHRSGILHRDLKPGNVILCRQKDGAIRAVITDFGLSSEGIGEVLGGTPGYMAPELQHGGRASPASDVFSLGVILYQLVTGQKPFPADAQDHGIGHTLLAPTKLVRNLSHRWDKAILPCLCSDPEKRSSAAEILHVLEHAPFYRRPALLVALAACFVVAVLAGLSILPPSPPVRLAILPVDAPANLAQYGQSIVEDIAKQAKEIQVGRATAEIIPPSKAMGKGIATPQEAERVLGATHALQLRLRPDADGLEAEGAIVDLRTMAHVRDYSGHFAEADLADLRTGLTGFASWALHFHRRSQPESVNPAAVSTYKNGNAYVKSEPADFQHAIPEFQQAIFLDPHSPLPPAGLAEAHIREYQIQRDEQTQQEAHRWLDMAEALNPDSPTVRRVSGLMYTIEGNYAKALEDYLRVEEIEPSNVEALLGSGLAYQLQGLPDKAMADYRLAISIDPNYYKSYEYLGHLYFRRGSYVQAEDMYRKDIACASHRPDGYGSLAGIYIAEAKYSEAEQVYKAFLGKKETALTLNNIGVMLAFQGRPKEASEYYRRAIAKDPNWPIYWLNLGDAQRRFRDLVNAKDAYRHGRAVALRRVTSNLANASDRAYLAYFQARLGLKKQARVEIASALNSPARDDQVLLCAVQTYEVLGDRERALGAAALATPQTRSEMDHHPDLVSLQSDSRFTRLINPRK